MEDPAGRSLITEDVITWGPVNALLSMFRETRLCHVAPISTNLMLSYVAEHVLGLPRSY